LQDILITGIGRGRCSTHSGRKINSIGFKFQPPVLLTRTIELRLSLFLPLKRRGDNRGIDLLGLLNPLRDNNIVTLSNPLHRRFFLFLKKF